MDILLDSHAFLWWDLNDRRLGSDVHQAIADPRNRVFVSAVSVWEIAIKRALGKLEFRADIGKAIASNGFAELPVTANHADRAAELPAHHRDPFDRMLIAQGVSENCVLVTRDRVFARYGIPCLWT